MNRYGWLLASLGALSLILTACPPPENQCSSDSDCSGSKVCVGGSCTLPDDGSSDTSSDTRPDSTDAMPDAGPTCDASKDPDGDGLDNCEEKRAGSDPNKTDTDGDGIDDNVEVEVAGTDPTKSDTDGDGIDDKTEFDGDTDPTKADTDGDGLNDKEEMDGPTDPTDADSDDDGLDDGAEQNAGSDPTKKDSDGDGLEDGAEVNQHGSDPTKSDSDGDGLSDFAEVNTHGTDPAKADTDGDGLNDKKEVNGNTDPTKGDTDGDGLDDNAELQANTDPTNPDTDGDGLSDGTEQQGKPDPTKADTDGDGLGDGAEVAFGSDPTKKDTDGDGADDKTEKRLGSDPTKKKSDSDSLDDGQEARLGLDPTKADTFGDGTQDGNRQFVQACLQGSSGSLNTHTSSKGNFSLTLPQSFKNYTTIPVSTSTSQNPKAAAVFSNKSDDVHGFVYSVPSNSSKPPTRQLQSLYGNFETSSRQASPDWFFAGFKTDDGHQAAPGEWDVTFSSGKKPEKARDRTMLGLAPFGQGDVSGFPSASGTAETSWRLHLSLVDRGGRLVVVGAMSPQSTVQNNKSVRFTLSNVVDTGALHVTGTNPSFKCAGKQPRKRRPRAEFYWVLDQSQSMDRYTSKIKGLAKPATSTLSASVLDYRLGVTNTDPMNNGRLRLPPGWHTGQSTFANEVDKAVINCENTPNFACSGRNEKALEVAKNGLTYMRGNGPSQPQQGESVRQNSDIYTVIQTDEEAHSVGPQNTLQSYTNYFQGTSNLFTIVGLGSNCGGSSADFQKISLETDGGFTSICANKYNRLIKSMLLKASAKSSNFKLNNAPIPSTIEVYIQGQKVSRSRSNGWDYVDDEQSLVFFGNARPGVTSNNNGESVLVIYEKY